MSQLYYQQNTKQLNKELRATIAASYNTPVKSVNIQVREQQPSQISPENDD